MEISKNKKEVLKALIDNARITDTKVGQVVGISTTGVGKIRRKLEEEGIIKRYIVDINPEKLGIEVIALLFIEAKPMAWETLGKNLDEVLATCPNCIGCIRLPGGRNTHMLMYAFKNVANADEYIHNMQTYLSDYFYISKINYLSTRNFIKNTETELVLYELGYTPQRKTTVKDSKVKDSNNYRPLSDNEVLVLEKLIENARVTDTKVGQVVGISTTGVGKIRRKLEEEGIIKGYVSKVSLGKLGYSIVVVASFRLLSSSDFSVLDIPQAVRILELPGTDETHLCVYVFKDMREVYDFFHNLKVKEPSLEIKSVHELSLHSVTKCFDTSKELLTVACEKCECDLAIRLVKSVEADIEKGQNVEKN